MTHYLTFSPFLLDWYFQDAVIMIELYQFNFIYIVKSPFGPLLICSDITFTADLTNMTDSTHCHFLTSTARPARPERLEWPVWPAQCCWGRRQCCPHRSTLSLFQQPRPETWYKNRLYVGLGWFDNNCCEVRLTYRCVADDVRFRGNHWVIDRRSEAISRWV